MNLFSASSLILSVCCFGLSIFIFLFRKNKLHRLWALFNLAIVVWAFGAFLGARITNKPLSILVWRLAHIGGIFISIFFYHTVCVLCNIRRRKVIVFAYLQGVFFSVLNTFSGLFISDVLFLFGSFYYSKASNLYFIPFSNWALLAVLGLYELSKFYKRADFAGRNKIRYIFLGFIIGYLGGVTYFLPMYGVNVYPVASCSLLVMTCLNTYALLKYRLLDIKVAITRAGIFLAIYTFVLGIPILIASACKAKCVMLLGADWWMIPMGLIVILAATGPYLYIFLQERSEKQLLKDQKRYQETLKHASIGITRIHDLEKLLSFIAHLITKSVRISRASIYLNNKSSRQYVLKFSRYPKHGQTVSLSQDSFLVRTLISRNNTLAYEEVKRSADICRVKSEIELEKIMRGLGASLVVPLSLENRLLGFLALGDKRSSQPYSLEDLNVFNILANQAALAVENAMFYEETRKMQEQISKAVKMSESIIETSIDGFAYIDSRGKLLDCNRAFCDLTGYRREELLRMCIQDLEALKELAELSRSIDSISREGHDRFETRYKRKDKTVLDVEISAHYMNEYGGRILLFVRDITTQKKVEQSLRLAQLGELVAGIAHEIRNPLMIISGKAQLSLLENNVASQVKDGLGVIMEQCVRSSDIINRLLKFSKPSKGDIQAVNIHSALDGLVQMLENQYSVRNIKIVKDYALSLPLIRVNEKEIQEVIMNLLHNAADAMPDGGRVTISTSGGPKSVKIAVTDTGCGISRENIQKLFTPFFTTKEKGTGLGLSVCYGLIKAHKGELKCDSQLGYGTTFTIVLPTEEVKTDV
jgi:PAS domain S-box-containing protein